MFSSKFILVYLLFFPFKPLFAQTSCGAATWPETIIKSSYAKKMGLLGDGIKVAIIDSGIDRDHPAFKHTTIVGKDFFGGNESAPYPYFDNEGHGTHVAGIVAGMDCNGSAIGLAPKAKLYVARVCGAEGCRSDDVGAGIEWAIEQNVDVINISIEGDSLHTSPKEMQAVRKAISVGIPVVTISGNGGASGSNNSIASIEGVIVVGAFNKWTEKPFFSQTSMQTLAAPGVNILSAYPKGKGYVVHGFSPDYKPDLVPLLNTPHPKNIKSEVAFVGFGSELESITAKGKIAVAEQGGNVAVSDKIKFAEQAGANALIILMNRPYFAVGLQTLDDYKIPVLFSAKDDKSHFLNLNKNHTPLTIDTYFGDYILESGTSMAAPFVTGTVALMKSLRKDLSPFLVRDILIRSATKVDLNLSPLDDPTFGAGALNVENALKQVR